MLDSRDITAANQQQLGLALSGRGSVNAPMPFAAGLCVNETFGAFAWRDLPGTHNRETFTASSWFRAVSTGNAGQLANANFGSAHGGEICFTVGATGYRTTGSIALGADATGAHQSLLGSLFTTGTSLVIASGTEATKVFTPTGLTGLTKPCEINGFIFFTACLSGLEVIAYLPPPLFVDDATMGATEQLARRVQHFTTEHLGTAARVGMFQGRPVVATTKGIWGIKALGDGQGYGIDAQIESWNLTPEVQFAITHDDVFALDQGTLLRKGASSELICGCGFTTLGSDGRIAVLSEPGGRFAVSNGADFEEFGGDQRTMVIGTLLLKDGAVLTTDRVAWTDAASVWLTTAWANFPNQIAIEALFLDPGVRRARVLTESGSYDLMRSEVAPAMWRAGWSGTRLKLMIEVPVGERLGIAPVIRLKRRTLG